MAIIDNLVAYYSMDAASGGEPDAHDDNDLSDNNTVGSAAGKVGNARDFERDNSEFLSIADNADVSTGDVDFTWVAWVRPETLGGVSQVILSKDDGATWEYSIYISNTAAVRFYVENGGSSEEVTTAVSVAQDATWFFVVAWHDAANNQVGIQVDNGTPVVESYSGGVADTAHTLRLGAESGATFFDGLIDEVGFWKRVLTSDERTWLYNAGNGRSYADIVAGMGAGGKMRPRRRLFMGVG